jgi:2-amino-4-hydroxy-6-hydroxymethyldihydropteridine diphosphokinase
MLFLQTALKAIELSAGDIISRSSVYETEAWGNINQPGFYNQAIEVNTKLEPEALLAAIKKIEVETGRKQRENWGPREIDIDILLLGDLVYQSPVLQIPHPFLPQRRFALLPLSEIAGKKYHPILNKTIDALLKDCEDKSEVVLSGSGLLK